MTLLTRLERKIGWIAVDNLPLYIVTAQGMIFIWSLFNPGQLHLLMLHRQAILDGREYWRLLTFLFIVPNRNAIFAFFYLYLLYIYGMALENEWGSFPFTLFYLIGALGTVVAALVFGNIGGSFFLNLTIFLAFAAIHPDFVLYLFFILPVKIKWLAWLTWGWLALAFFPGPLQIKATILVSLSNYFLFFSKTHVEQVAEMIGRAKHRRRFRNRFHDHD